MCINSYASYENPGQTIAIQTIIIEKQVPVPVSKTNKTIFFSWSIK